MTATLPSIRPVIAESWSRAARMGLARDGDVLAEVDAVELDSALVRAAAPVIEDLAAQLGDTDCALLLADRSQRIAVSRFGDRRVGAALDAVAAVPGATYTEQTSSTNAITTVFELGQGAFVLAEEHYLNKRLRQ